MRKVIMTLIILILATPLKLFAFKDECPWLHFPEDLEDNKNIDFEEVCGITILVKDGKYPSNVNQKLNLIEKKLDNLKYLKNLEILRVGIASPREKDSTFFKRIFEKIPNTEKIKSLSIGYSGPLPNDPPNFPNLERFQLFNYYDEMRNRPFEEPVEFFFPRQDEEDSIAIAEFAKSFSPPPFPDQFFRVIKNVENVSMWLSRSDTLLPDKLFNKTLNIRSLIIKQNGLKKLPFSLWKLNKLQRFIINDCFLESVFPEEWDSYPDSLIFFGLGDPLRIRTIYKDQAYNEFKEIYSKPCVNLEEFSLDFMKLPRLEAVDLNLPNVQELDKTLKKLPPNLTRVNFQNLESLVSLGDNVCRGEMSQDLLLAFLGASSLENIKSLKNCNIRKLYISSFNSNLIWDQLQKVIKAGKIQELILDYGSIKKMSPRKFQAFSNLAILEIHSDTYFTRENRYRIDKEEIDEKWLKEIKEILPDTEVIVK